MREPPWRQINSEAFTRRIRNVGIREKLTTYVRTHRETTVTGYVSFVALMIAGYYPVGDLAYFYVHF